MYGTRAKFGNRTYAEDIYHLVVYASETAVEPDIDAYTTLAEVQRNKVKAERNGKIVVADRVTEPLPLDATGHIDESAIYDNANYPYRTKVFNEYRNIDFSTLPFSK
jgi:hypothetical protein